MLICPSLFIATIWSADPIYLHALLTDSDIIILTSYITHISFLTKSAFTVTPS